MTIHTPLSKQPFLKMALVKIVLVTLVSGLAAAAIVVGFIAALQYSEIANSRLFNGPHMTLFIDPFHESIHYLSLPGLFAPDRKFDVLLDMMRRKFFKDSLALMMPQSGVVTGVLALMVMRAPDSTTRGVRYGLISGMIVGVVECVVMWFTGVPIGFILFVLLLIVSAGLIAGWYAQPPLPPTPPISD